MARCKFDWILSLSALVGCVLIGSRMASAVLWDSDLKTELQRDNLKPEDVKEILLKYVGEYTRISRYLAEELVDMWELSVSRCSRAHFSALDRLAREHRAEGLYYEEPIIKIAEYAEYCRSTLKVYCIENIDDVLLYLLGEVTEEDTELVRHLLESLRKQGVRGNPTIAQVNAAYLALKESTYKDTSITSNREQIFRRRINRVLYRCREIFPLLGELFPDEDRAMLPPGSDILLTEWFNLKELITIFSRSVSSQEKSTVTRRQIEELNSKLHDKNAEPEDIRSILKDFEDERVGILSFTVQQFLDQCEFSIGRCSYQKIREAQVGIPGAYEYGKALHEYSVYCLEKLKEYCAENTEQVIRFFLASTSKDDKKLARLYLESIPEKDLDTATEDDMITAYRVIRSSIFGDKSISTKMAIYFNDKVKHLFKHLGDMHFFFAVVIQTKPVFESTSEKWWYDLGNFSEEIRQTLYKPRYE